MGVPTPLTILRDPESLRVRMPAGRNRWFVWGAVLFSVPWLVAVVAGIVIAIRVIPDTRKGLVVVAILLGTFALTVFIDLLAFALLWLAFYTTSGSETLEVTRSHVRVRRKALGITMKVNAKRGHFDRVLLLDQRVAPGEVAHPKIEVTAAYSKIRLGAGLDQSEAAEVARAIEAFMGECGPE